jgi:hypothetical protein
MKTDKRHLALAVASLGAAFVAVSGPATADEDALLFESRNVVGSFAAELQTALQDAMAAGGPVAAIEVCKDVAPEIAERMSAETGATVGRTSLRLRNPANTPSDWQRDVLEDFVNGANDEFFERIGNNGARYMKAIKTGALCLNCHGTVLAPDVRRQLDDAYPDDQARGYYLDDIRGAFLVIWPEAGS